MHMKRLLSATLALLLSLVAFSQARYNYDQLVTERLNRGLVAIRQADGRVALSWRTLRSDRKGEPFDVYRNGQKLNTQPLTQGGTFFVDESPLAGEALTYEVRGGGVDGSFTLRQDAPVGYLPVRLQRPKAPLSSPEGDTIVRKSKTNEAPSGAVGGASPSGAVGGAFWGRRRGFLYSANDCSVGDVDGDGQYELFVKWEPSNAHDNSHDGYTGSTLIDCYRLDGTMLWRIDLGRNIRSGAHYVPFIVYDLDGDGRAELMVKTADGTRDGLGRVIGDSLADYRNRAGRILEGPEYISVFNGLTGAEMDTKPYIPPRGNVRDWGDDRGNRSERYLAAVAYLKAPLSSRATASAVFCRGYYTRSVLAAWDWDGQQLTNRWVFDTNNTEWSSYAGQGNHNLRVADVDGDGLDEITYGSMAVDHDGRGLYNTGMGHGDAIHLVADPKDNRLYIWDCHENKRDGSDLRDARTGEVVFQIKSRTDVGRAMAADIDPTNPGVEMWSTDSHGIRNMKGEKIFPQKTLPQKTLPQKTLPRPLPVREGSGYTQSAKSQEGNEQKEDVQDNSGNVQDNTVMSLPTPLPHREGSGEGLSGKGLSGKGIRLSVNFGMGWDGDLLRELLDHETVSKYNWQETTVDTIQRFDGQFNNGTKSNPCLQADLLGDWREEVIVRDRESTELRIYVSTIPTSYRIDCLMHDIPYRLSVATENVGYNQPPEAGFYIGPDRTDYLK